MREKLVITPSGPNKLWWGKHGRLLHVLNGFAMMRAECGPIELSVDLDYWFWDHREFNVYSKTVDLRTVARRPWSDFGEPPVLECYLLTHRGDALNGFLRLSMPLGNAPVHRADCVAESGDWLVSRADTMDSLCHANYSP